MTRASQELTRRLAGTEGGRWLVATESGTSYLFDLDAMTVRRTAAGGPLRRDGQDLVLWAVHQLRLGEPAVIAICVIPDVLTVRVTTTVTAIRSQVDSGLGTRRRR